jgi:hypothetical protein
MPDDTSLTGLAWVQEPAISEGKVVYRYRNSGETDATFVGESVSAFTASGVSTSQSFSLENLAVDAEQETHAPMPADLPDGPITINIQIQSTSEGAYAGQLLYELRGQVAGAVVHPEGEQAAATGGALAVDVVDLRLDGEEVVLHYRFTGDAHLDSVSVSMFVLDSQGASKWMNSFIAEVDREDIFRTSIPFGEVMDSDEAGTIEAVVLGTDQKANVEAHVRVRLPVEWVDGTVVAASGWSSESES